MDNRQNILHTATRLFAEQGFAGVSLRAIAERVGISKPSLLYHFPSKDHLRERVLDNLFEHWATTLPRLLRAVTSGEGMFDALMHELGVFFAEDADRARLIVRELMDRPDEMRRRVGASLSPLVTLIADAIRRGQELGVLQKSVDPEVYILHMIGLTLANIVTREVIQPIVGEGDAGAARQERELRRIAQTSLFQSLPDAPAADGQAHST